MSLALAVIRRLEPNYSRSLVRLQVLFQPTEPIWKNQPNPFSRDFNQDEMGYIWEVNSLPGFSERGLLRNTIPCGAEYVAIIFPLSLRPSMVKMLEAIGDFTEAFQGTGSQDILEPLNQMKGLEDYSFITEFPQAMTLMVQLARLIPQVIPAGAAELAMYSEDAKALYAPK